MIYFDIIENSVIISSCISCLKLWFFISSAISFFLQLSFTFFCKYFWAFQSIYKDQLNGHSRIPGFLWHHDDGDVDDGRNLRGLHFEGRICFLMGFGSYDGFLGKQGFMNVLRGMLNFEVLQFLYYFANSLYLNSIVPLLVCLDELQDAHNPLNYVLWDPYINLLILIFILIKCYLFLSAWSSPTHIEFY